jgi:hypothetical protein
MWLVLFLNCVINGWQIIIPGRMENFNEHVEILTTTKKSSKKGGKQIWSSLKRSTKTVAIDYCVADFDLGTSPPGIFRQFFSSRSPCP